MTTPSSPGVAATDGPLIHATTLLELRRPEQAAAVLAAYLGDRPDDPQGWLLLAHARDDLDDPAGALEAADQALHLAPHNPLAWRLRAGALHALDRTVEALTAIDEAARLAPHGWLVHLRRATILADLPGRGVDAYAAARQATALAPEEATTHRVLALTAENLGKPWLPVAEQALRTALSLDPQDAVALNNLGALHINQQRQRATLSPPTIFAAAKIFAAALAADPQSPQPRRNLAGTTRTLVLMTIWPAVALLGAARVGHSAAISAATDTHSVSTGWIVQASATTMGALLWLLWAYILRRQLPTVLRAQLFREPQHRRRILAIALLALTSLAPLAFPPTPTTPDPTPRYRYYPATTTTPTAPKLAPPGLPLPSYSIRAQLTPS